MAGPIFRRWSALGLVMMLSQMTASLVELTLLASGHSAVTYTKRDLVFQVKREVRFASMENLIMAYSSFFEE